MSPEQSLGITEEVDERSDVFSLGAILYEILTGRRAFEKMLSRDTLATMGGDTFIPIRSLNYRIPVDIAKVCTKAIQRNADQRYQSVGEFLDSLNKCRLRRPKSRIRRLLEFLVILFILFLPILFVIGNWYSEMKLEEVETSLTEKGLCIRVRDVSDIYFCDNETQRNLLTRDSEEEEEDNLQSNASGRLYGLHLHFPYLHDSPFWDKYPSKEWWYSRSEEEVSVDAQKLALCQELLTEVKEICDMPIPDEKDILSGMSFFEDMPYQTHSISFIGMRRIHGLLMEEACLRLRQGRYDAALENCQYLIILALHLNALPDIMSHLMADLIVLDTTIFCFKHIEEFPFSSEKIPSLKESLQRYINSQALRHVSEIELRRGLWRFHMLKTNTQTFIRTQGDSPYSLSAAASILYSSPICRFWLNFDQMIYMKVMAEWIDIFDDPYWEGKKLFDTQDHKLESEKLSFSVPLSAMLINELELEKRYKLNISAKTFAIMNYIVISLYEYHQKHALFPGTIDALPGQPVAALAIDPYSGNPFIYYVLNNTAALISVGPNGILESDVSLLERAIAEKNGDDIVWKINTH